MGFQTRITGGVDPQCRIDNRPGGRPFVADRFRTATLPSAAGGTDSPIAVGHRAVAGSRIGAVAHGLMGTAP